MPVVHGDRDQPDRGPAGGHAHARHPQLRRDRGRRSRSDCSSCRRARRSRCRSRSPVKLNGYHDVTATIERRRPDVDGEAVVRPPGPGHAGRAVDGGAGGPVRLLELPRRAPHAQGRAPHRADDRRRGPDQHRPADPRSPAGQEALGPHLGRRLGGVAAGLGHERAGRSARRSPTSRRRRSRRSRSTAANIPPEFRPGPRLLLPGAARQPATDGGQLPRVLAGRPADVHRGREEATDHVRASRPSTRPRRCARSSRT